MYKELSKISLIAFILITNMTSCKKERVNGEYAALVGTWDYNYSRHWSGHCNPYPIIYDTIFSSNQPKDYTLEFEKKGILNNKIDGVTTTSHRIKFGPTGSGASGVPGSVTTILYLDGDEENFLVCIWNGTDLIMTGFPFFADSCNYYEHYFLPG